jgi:asparagine synthase (glutamine-hydrolysing)
MTSFFRFGPGERGWMYGPLLQEELHRADPEGAIAEPFELATNTDNLHRMLYADMVTRLPEHTLMLTDRLSMAHGLEMRAPFLDHKLAEFCFNMPAHLKIRRGITKYALRQAAQTRLPLQIVRRRKQGFMFPMADWLNGSILEKVRATLLNGPLVSGDWIRADGIDRLLAEHQQRRADHHVRIWMLLNLDAWFRIYFNQRKVAISAASQSLWAASS